MVIYGVLICAALAGGWVLKKWPGRLTRYGYLIVLGIACWLVASLRYLTGFDYRFYEDVFYAVREATFPGFMDLQGMEPGYLLLNKLVAVCGGDYRSFLFLFHFLLTGIVFWWIGRYAKAPWLSVYLFLTLQFFALTMNLLRQSMAAAIFLLAFPFLQKRKLIPYVILILMAACFHRTVLLMLPFYFLLALPVTRLHYGTVLCLTAVAYFSMDPLLRWVFTLLPKYQHYLESKYWQGNSIVYILLPLGCVCFLFPLFRRLYQDRRLSPILANAMLYSFLLQLFITRHFLLERFSIYLAILGILALPEAALTASRIPVRIRIGILLAGGMVYFLFAVSQGFHDVYPYVSIWQQAMY